MATAATVFGRQGLPDGPVSHGHCPVCDKTTIWIPKSGNIAKCFNAECERYGKPWFSHSHKANKIGWCVAALNPFSKACIEYLRHDGQGDPLRQKALDYLVNTRCIAPEIIGEVKIGVIPPGVDVEPFIQAAKQSATYTDEASPNKIESQKVETDLASPLRDHVKTKAGWLAFFYEDANEDVVAVNFRQIDKDEAGKNVIRLFNPIGKKGVFNAYLYSGTERALIGEGEFNNLRYMSEVARAYGADWKDHVQDNITVGSSTGVDIKTLGSILSQYGCVPVVAEDNDKSGAGVTTKVAQGGRKTLHFCFEGKPATYDLDNFFSDATNGKQAIEEIHKSIQFAETFVRPLAELAEELDKIRDGKIQVEEENPETGEIKLKWKGLPGHVVDMQVWEFVLSHLQARGEFYVCTYAYLYDQGDKRLLRFQKDSVEMSDILRQLHLLLTQDHYRLVQSNLENHILNHGKDAEIHKLGAFIGDNIYVNKGDGKLFKISDAGISVVDNGTDDVLVDDPTLVPWPDLDIARMREIQKLLDKKGMRIGNTPLCNYLRANWAERGLVPEQYEQLFFSRFMSLFVTNYLGLWPLMVAIGEMNDGKSTAFEKIMWLLYGLGYESEMLPADKRSFLAAVTNQSMCVFDNVDGVDFEEEGLEDIICKCSTGGQAPMAELYKTNVMKKFTLRCNIFFTARYTPYERSDMARRTIYFPMRRLTSEERRSKDSIQRPLRDHRDDLCFEILLRLNYLRKSLVASRDREFDGGSDMLDYETYTLRVAEQEGWLPEMRAIWLLYRADYQERLATNNTLIGLLAPYLGTIGYNDSLSNIGRPLKPTEIWDGVSELCKRSGEKMTYLSAKSMRTALDKNLEALRVIGCQRTGKSEHWRYTFKPGEEWQQRCRERYLEIQAKGGR